MNPYQERYLSSKLTDKQSPLYLCHLFSYVVIKKVVNLAHKHLFDEFEYQFGKAYAGILMGLHAKKLKGQSLINAALTEFENLGFGKTHIVVLQSNKVILKNINSPIAKQFSKSFFDCNENVDYYLAGVYSGILSIHFKKNIDITETKCFSAGAQECYFEGSLDQHNTYGVKELLDNTLHEYSINDLKSIDYPNIFGELLFKRKNYVIQNGVIRVVSILHSIFRIPFFVYSNNILSAIKNDVSSLYRYLGFVNIRIAGKFQKSQFGRMNPVEISQELLNNMNLFGYGIGKITSHSEKECTIAFEHSLLLKQSLQLMSSFCDPYLEGVILGLPLHKNKNPSTITVIGKDTFTIEISIGYGKKSIATELKKQISPKIKEIINERMKHIYYLTPS